MSRSVAQAKSARWPSFRPGCASADPPLAGVDADLEIATQACDLDASNVVSDSGALESKVH